MHYRRLSFVLVAGAFGLATACGSSDSSGGSSGGAAGSSGTGGTSGTGGSAGSGTGGSAGAGTGGSAGAGTGGSAGAGTGGSAGAGTGGSAGAGTGGSAGAGTGGSAGAGAGGACNNATDLPKMQTQQTATDASTCGGLAGGCFTQAAGAKRSKCVADCMQQKQGFTSACAACWGAVVDCGITHCAATCINPTSAACKTCTDQNCTPAFNTCALGQ